MRFVIVASISVFLVGCLSAVRNSAIIDDHSANTSRVVTVDGESPQRASHPFITLIPDVEVAPGTHTFVVAGHGDGEVGTVTGTVVAGKAYYIRTYRDGKLILVDRATDPEWLVMQLSCPASKVIWQGTSIPGGEQLKFSAAMMDLIRLGPAALASLHPHITDSRMQNEVVLILGAIGDSSTIPLLIEAYPTLDKPAHKATDEERLRIVCFSFALSRLTCQKIDRNREGTDFHPKNREQWRSWWAQQSAAFVVPTEKPRDSWMPNYDWSLEVDPQ